MNTCIRRDLAAALQCARPCIFLTCLKSCASPPRLTAERTRLFKRVTHSISLSNINRRSLFRSARALGLLKTLPHLNWIQTRTVSWSAPLVGYDGEQETANEIGGADRDRTGDPLLAKQVLSQLSYSPVVNMVGLGRVELPTSPLSGVRSNQLSYRPVFERYRKAVKPGGSLKTSFVVRKVSRTLVERARQLRCR